MHAVTPNTGATVRNAAQPVRPDEVTYSSTAFSKLQEMTLEKFGSVMILLIKYQTCLLSPFAIENKHLLYTQLNHAGL